MWALFYLFTPCKLHLVLQLKLRWLIRREELQRKRTNTAIFSVALQLPLDRRNPPTLPSAELPTTEEIRRTEENLEDHDYIGRTAVKALRVHTTMVEINRWGIVNSKPECNPRPIF